MNKIERITRYWLAFLFYILFVFALSSVPAANLPDFKWNFSDSVIHFFEYVVFGFLCIRAIRVSYPGFRQRYIFTAAILFSLAFAISDEIHQVYVPGRLCETTDLVSDNLGAIFGVFIYGKARFEKWLK